MKTRGRKPGILTIAAVALVASLLGGGVAMAGSTFTDVGPSHPFVDEIEAIADAGITTGFTDGTYRPGVAVSRGAMAAFMGRGFGRVASASGTPVENPTDGTSTNGATVAVTSGATESGGGYVVVTGTAQMNTAVTDCQCTLAAEVRDATAGSSGPTRSSMSDDVNVFTINSHAVSVQGVFPLAADQTHSFTVRFRATTAGGNTAITVSSHIAATYVPFDGSGNAP